MAGRSASKRYSVRPRPSTRMDPRAERRRPTEARPAPPAVLAAAVAPGPAALRPLEAAMTTTTAATTATVARTRRRRMTGSFGVRPGCVRPGRMVACILRSSVVLLEIVDNAEGDPHETSPCRDRGRRCDHGRIAGRRGAECG